MSGTTELLNYVYNNTQMGVNTIKQLLDIVEDEDFKVHLESQYKEYKEINEIAEQKLHEMGKEGEGIGSFNEMSAYLMINMKTLMDKSATHIAEMLISGSTKGIVQATRNLKKYSGEEASAVDLMQRLLKTEENNFQQLKKFL